MSNTPNPPVMSLIRKGTSQYPRYIITKGDDARNPVYWNDENQLWIPDEDDTTMSADVTQAAWIHHDLQKEYLEAFECHRYMTPIYIEMYGNKPNLDKLKNWLERAVRIVLNTPLHGKGPDGAVGVLIADFEELKESKSTSDL